MKSSSQHSFAQVPSVSVPRSVFYRNSTHKTTFNAGLLVPVYVGEVLPGDTWSMHLTQFARLQSPLKFPIMDNMYLDTHCFFVPNRLLWEHWEQLCGARDAGIDYEDDTEYLTPTISSPASTGWAINSLSDHFGLPTGVPDITVNALYHRAYNRIFNDWYRDENLVAEIPQPMGDGPDDNADYVLRRRSKRHDYFTSALLWPQKGPSVDIPLGGFAPVVGNGMALGLTNGSEEIYLGVTSGGSLRKPADNTLSTTIGTTNIGGGVYGVSTDSEKSGLRADLSSATAATINSLRQAFQIQRLFERDAIGGTRYVETLKAHFGVTSPDARLQRAEYLGGGSTPIVVHSVANTNGASGSDIGKLGAYALAANGKVGWSKSFVEHGIVMVICSVRADLTYQQGIPREFLRRDRFDYYWPALSHLGEQAIYNKEIYAQGSSVVDAQGNAVDDKVFGYQERYGEYRYSRSTITGEFRSTATNSLDIYHLAQEFANLPVLSQQFIEENPPIDRVVAVTSAVSNQFLHDMLVECKCVRPMPMYGTPGLIDHL